MALRPDQLFLRCSCGEDGQDQTEYALLMVLVALASVAGLGVAGDQLVVYWEALGSRLTDVAALLTALL